MKSFLRKIQYILLLLLTINVFGQEEKQVEQIRNDPDWRIIYNNNTDFLNRLARQPYSLSNIWSLGQESFLQQLNYTRDEYIQKRTETREAAARLLNRFPELNSPGACDGCRQTERQLIGKVDNFVRNLRLSRGPDAASFLREFEEVEGDEDTGYGPKCGLKFYACVLVCAGTIEVFPVYLACCIICLCEYCKNPPSWCN